MHLEGRLCKLDKLLSAASTSLALALFRNMIQTTPESRQTIRSPYIHVTRASVSSITSEVADISGFKQVGHMEMYLLN